jgi:hypothetical protein
MSTAIMGHDFAVAAPHVLSDLSKPEDSSNKITPPVLSRSQSPAGEMETTSTTPPSLTETDDHTCEPDTPRTTSTAPGDHLDHNDCDSVSSRPRADSNWDDTPRQSEGAETPSVCSQWVPSLYDSPRESECARIRAAKEEEYSFDVINAACEMVGLYLCNMAHATPHSSVRSMYDAVSEPKITLPCYFERIRHYSLATPESILCSVVLIKKIVASGQLQVTLQNVHRLLVTAIMVFAKFYDDEIDSNCRWARIAGLKKCEMNNMEIMFLNHCQFDLRVSPDQFHDIVAAMLEFSRRPPLPATPTSEESVRSEPSPKPMRSTRSHISVFHVKSRNHDKAEHSKTQLHRRGSVGDQHHHSTSTHDKSKSHHSIMSFFHAAAPHSHRRSHFPSSPDSVHLSSPISSPVCSPGPGSRVSASVPPSTPSSAENTPRRGLVRPPSVPHQLANLIGHRSPTSLFTRKKHHHHQHAPEFYSSESVTCSPKMAEEQPPCVPDAACDAATPAIQVEIARC